MYVCLPYSLLCQHCHQHQHPHLHQDLDDLHLGVDRLRAETALRLEDEGICGKTLVIFKHFKAFSTIKTNSTVIG